MKLPITGWKRTLKSLGFKVHWENLFRAKEERAKRRVVKRRREIRANSDLCFESLEPRQLLATLSSGLPLLHSDLNATATVFLDFDGHGSNEAFSLDADTVY